MTPESDFSQTPGKRVMFKARRRESDGKMLPLDLVLEVVVTLAFEESASGTLEIRWRGKDEAAKLTGEALLEALVKKRLDAIDSHGTRKDLRSTAREVILDILANKADWAPYHEILGAFAAKNDQDFFSRLVRGRERKRKPLFEPVEWFCLLNWHEWNLWVPPGLEKCPPLKFWTDSAVLELLAMLSTQNEGLGVSGLRTKRVRLGLKQEKPSRVTGVFPVPGQPGWLKVEP